MCRSHPPELRDFLTADDAWWTDWALFLALTDEDIADDADHLTAGVLGLGRADDLDAGIPCTP